MVKSYLLNGHKVANSLMISQLVVRAKSAIKSEHPVRRLTDYITGSILFSLPENVRRSIYKGDSYYCPVCETHLRTFLRLYRPYHAWCPVCKSLQRHRLTWIFLNSSYIQIDQAELRMLHFAPEPGIAKRIKSIPTVDYISADISNKLADLKIDVCYIPFQDQSFSLIYCSHVLEHVPDDAQAMGEFYRVLQPDGKIILQVPIAGEATFEDAAITDPLEREKYFGQIDHIRFYGKDIIQRLTKAGFRVQEFITEDLVSPADITVMGLNAGEILFLCEK